MTCTACGSITQNPKPVAPFSSGGTLSARDQSWFWCGLCGSCFSGNARTVKEDVAYHQRREWGLLERFPGNEAHHRRMYKHICSGLLSRGLEGGSVLDVGASFGGFLTEAQSAGL